jgi:PAS domain S-box-containing protein
MDARHFLHEPISARLWQAIIAGVGLIFSTGLALLVQHYQASAEQQRFERQVDEIREAVRSRFDTYAHLLEAVRVVFLDGHEVTTDTFRAAVDSLAPRQYPGIMAIGFVQGLPGLEARPLRFSVSITSELPPPLGLDYGAEPIRRSVTDSAMLEGRAVLSERLLLRREGHGHLYVLPVYRPGHPTHTPLMRREALLGWLSMPLRIEEMMRDFPARYGGLFDIELHDQSGASPVQLLFDADDTPYTQEWESGLRRFHASRNLDVGGRKWLLTVGSLPAYEAQAAGPWLPMGAFAAGLVFSLLAATLVGQLRRVSQESEQSLRDSREYLAQVFRHAVEGIIVIDEQGMIEQFNPAAEKLFGYRAEEVVGRNVSLLMPSPHRERHDGYIARYLAGAPPRVIGIGREVTGLAKDGRLLALQLGVSRFTLRGKVRFVGMLTDIGEHKRMQEELRQHRDQLQAMVDAQTAELRAAKEAAERANAMKSAFFAQISHELRTPLHAINSYAEIALDKRHTLPPEKMQQYLSKIHDAGERLVAMVNDLLDLSKLDAGKMHFHFHRADVLPALREVGAELQALAERKAVSIVFQPAEVSTTLVCDISRLQQVMRNLLANAIRFSPQGGTVTVRFAPTRLPGRRAGDAGIEALLITVSDQGPGIAPDELESIFDEYAQSQHAAAPEGTGLGLAVSRHIVQAHQGKIWAENESTGGARLMLALPYHPAT